VLWCSYSTSFFDENFMQAKAFLVLMCSCVLWAATAFAQVPEKCTDPTNTDQVCLSLRSDCKKDLNSHPECANLTAARAKAMQLPQPGPLLFSDDVRKTIDDCKATLACGANLSEFEDKKKDQYLWIKTWCNSRKSVKNRSDDEKVVCDGTKDNGKPEDVSIFTLANLADAIDPASCSGFGLSIPLFAIRYAGGTSVVGPVKAGLGGGYYYGAYCQRDFSVGPEVFGWSQGLDPSGDFQIGVAGGVQFVAYKYFQFGAALGYDLYRQGTGISTDGLFSGKNLGKPSLTTLLTFTITNTAAESNSAKTSM
jgi:hypothetical protein